MPVRIAWSTVAFVSVCITGGVVLTVTHNAVPPWLLGILVAIGGSLPQMLKGGTSS